MESVDQRLVRRQAGLIQLFDPPFDQSPLNPGYIKGYIPGVRENGGQYTHGAIWTAMAFALLKKTTGPGSCLRCSSRPSQRHTQPDRHLQSRALRVAGDVTRSRRIRAEADGPGTRVRRLDVSAPDRNAPGLNLEGDQLRLAPRLPKTWTTFAIHYRYRQRLITSHHATRREVAQLQSNIPRWTVSDWSNHPPGGRSPRPFCRDQSSSLSADPLHAE